MRIFVAILILLSTSFTIDVSYAAKSKAKCTNIFKGTNEKIPEGLKSQLEGMTYDYVYTASLDELDNILYDYDNRKVPKFRERKNKTTHLEVSNLRFMQKSAKFKSSSRKGGYEVLETARSLQTGKLDIDDLPMIQVWEDKKGRLWTLDHRRLAAIILAGNFTEVPVDWATQQEVEDDWDKYDPINGGLSMDIVNYRERERGGQWAVRISIP